ncbi:hypothetical protein Aab01nite_24680 [Paractinoplanes abujensis]|uniref:Uncharacterized protein n=1 Tax=Paractinoplanes abujensis TaxID=882441 RepID=A0A7W7CXW0_9ACTN|nr:hypothetical protein [Actinoplanes abujensis]MBB4696658.1 hypothetical protein [Actinoplanes abujensis]GID18878.1 hypothetical protein Aab01nite_24680 [Actinoplanes abujensis]
MTSAVLDEALKKAALAWVAVGDGPALALWVLPLDGTLIVVSGPGEQFAPGLAEATRATVRLRGDNGGLIVITEAAVSRIAPGSDEWTEVAPQLAAKRLNATGTADEVAARWAATGCAVVRLTPVAEQPVVERPDLPASSGAAEPRDSPARVETPRPFRLHRVKRR